MTDFKAKMHQIRSRLGLCPRPRSGSLQRSPDPLLDFGVASRQGERLGWGRGGKEGGEGVGGGSGGREREDPQVTVEPGPLRDFYATAVTSQILMLPGLNKLT